AIVPPCCGCGWQTTAVPRGGSPGASMAHSSAPAGPAIVWRTVCAFMSGGMAKRLAADVRRELQALHRLALLQVRIDDLVDVVLVDVGVPDGVGVDHRHRTAGAAVQAACLVDAHLARAGQALGLDARLAVVEAGLRIVVGAAGLADVAAVQAEEDVPLVVAH